MLDRLFRDCSADLTRYFTRRHGSGTHVHDMVQETFLQLARGLQKELRIDSGRGYLFGVARRISQATWREQSKQPSAFFEQHPPIQPTAPPDERLDEAREAIAGMEPLQLRFVQSLSYAEIATALEVPVGTVRSRLHNSIKQLRLELNVEKTQPQN